MKYMVKVVSGGCCLGDVNPVAVERMIQAQANQGWRFVQLETVISTFCLFLHRNNTIIIFCKNDNEDNVPQHENKLENPNEMSLNIQKDEKAETTQNSSAINEDDLTRRERRLLPQMRNYLLKQGVEGVYEMPYEELYARYNCKLMRINYVEGMTKKDVDKVVSVRLILLPIVGFSLVILIEWIVLNLLY